MHGALGRGEDPEGVLKAIETIQKLLPEEGYAVGEWSIADAAVTPFFARAEVAFKNEIGKYEEGKGKATWAKHETDEKYARFRKYFADLKSRESFKETFHPVCPPYVKLFLIFYPFLECGHRYILKTLPAPIYCLGPIMFNPQMYSELMLLKCYSVSSSTLNTERKISI